MSSEKSMKAESTGSKRDKDGFLIPKNTFSARNSSSSNVQNQSILLDDVSEEIKNSLQELCLKTTTTNDKLKEILKQPEVLSTTSPSPVSFLTAKQSTVTDSLSFKTARQSLSSVSATFPESRSLLADYRENWKEEEESNSKKLKFDEDWLNVSVQTGKIKNLKPFLVKAGTRPVSGLKLIYRNNDQKSPKGLGGTFFWLEDAPEGYEWVLESSD